jgi:hypothetical protein
MVSLRGKIRERTDCRYARLPLEWTVEDLNPVLRGWRSLAGTMSIPHVILRFDDELVLVVGGDVVPQCGQLAVIATAILD